MSGFWVGVVGSPTGLQRIRTEDVTWWCAPPQAADGDFIAMYVARNRMRDVPEQEGGIGTIFRVLGAFKDHATDCSTYGTAMGGPRPVPIKIQVTHRFANTLSLTEMKIDPTLARSAFVRRSFQGTCFSATPEQFERIRVLLKVLNAPRKAAKS